MDHKWFVQYNLFDCSQPLLYVQILLYNIHVEIMRSLPPYIRQLNRHSLRNPILEDSGTIN